MPNTSEGFYYPDANTNIAPLETVLANMAASSDTVSKQTPRVFANYAAMVAGIPSPVGGRLAITTQGNGILWQYDGTAAKWVVQNRPVFSSATARNAAIPAPTAGIVAVISTGSNYAEYSFNGTEWQQWSLAESQLGAVFTPGGTFTDLGMPIGAQNPGTGSVWEVTVNLDAEVAVSAASTFEAQLVAAGARVGEIVAGCAPGMVGLRVPLTRTWRVSGMPSGWTVFEVQVKATGAGVWRLYPVHSHMLVRQVA